MRSGAMTSGPATYNYIDSTLQSLVCGWLANSICFSFIHVYNFTGMLRMDTATCSPDLHWCTVSTLAHKAPCQQRKGLSKYLSSDLPEFLRMHLHSEVSKGYSHASEVSGKFPRFWNFGNSFHSFRDHLFSHHILSEFTSVPSPIT